jgi:two-component SAPR family response regulator
MEILLVDDDETLNQSLTLLLQTEGYRVTPALSGERALELAALQYFDLVLCDVRMPGMSGIDAIGALKDLLTDADFIVMTAYASNDAPVEALRLGVGDYLSKPFDLPSFLEKIGAIARRRKRGDIHSRLALRNLLGALKEHFPARAARSTAIERACLESSGDLTARQARLLEYGAWLYPLADIDSPPEDAQEDEATTEAGQLASLLRRISLEDREEPLCRILSDAVTAVEANPQAETPSLEIEVAEPQQGLSVTTLGELEVRMNGEPIVRKAWQSASARWVFLYLLTRGGQAVPEDRLAAMFWPGSPPAKSHRNLVSSVHRARKALNDSSILVRYDKSYGINRDYHYELDLDRVLGAYKRGCDLYYRKDLHEALDCFQEMRDHYTGDFIPECDDEWCRRIREDLRLKMVDALERSCTILVDSDPMQVEALALQAIEIENTSERAWSSLFQSLAKLGRKREVEAAFERCVKTLKENLGLNPSASLKKSYRASMAESS